MKRERWVASNKAILCKNMGQHSTQHCIGGREREREGETRRYKTPTPPRVPQVSQRCVSTKIDPLITKPHSFWFCFFGGVRGGLINSLSRGNKDPPNADFVW